MSTPGGPRKRSKTNPSLATRVKSDAKGNVHVIQNLDVVDPHREKPGVIIKDSSGMDGAAFQSDSARCQIVLNQPGLIDHDTDRIITEVTHGIIGIARPIFICVQENADVFIATDTELRVGGARILEGKCDPIRAGRTPTGVT